MKKIDFKRAENFKQDAKKRGLHLQKEYIGTYNHIIQEYITEQTWSNLIETKEIMDNKFDTSCTIWGGGGIHFLEAQFYPI